MKNLFFVLLVFFVSETTLQAQEIQGMVTYNRKTDYLSIMAKLPHISQEEADRMALTWGNWNSEGTDYELTFKNGKTLYQAKEVENTSGYSWKPDKFMLTRDYRTNQKSDVIETLGKVFLINEEIPKTKWKILNEIKEVAGYLCMKAETENLVKGQTVHAWFADGINLMGGPEGYGGLPGLILEIDINGGDAIITATDVKLELPEVNTSLPKKNKGKKVTQAEFDGITKKYIEETLEGKKNPYWRVRY